MTTLGEQPAAPTPLPYGSETGRTCDCDLCRYSRKVTDAQARRDPDELLRIVDELMNANYNMGHDLEYANCVLDGSWSSSVEQLQSALKKARKHPNRKTVDKYERLGKIRHMNKVLVRYLFSLGAIKRGDFPLASGGRTDIYCDMRDAVLDGGGLELASSALENALVPYEFDTVGAVEGVASGVLLGALLQKLGDMKGFVVRKEAKSHGTGRMIEGTVGNHPILIDDVATKGGSLVRSIKAMPTRPIAAVVLVDRKEGATEALKELHVPLISVFTLDEIRAFQL